MSYQLGDIVLVDLEPTIGSEQGFKRPAIVVSKLDRITESHSKPLYVIVPLTRSEKLLGKLAPRLTASQGSIPMDSIALIMHLRSIDPKRVIKHVGKLPMRDLKEIQEGIAYLFGANKDSESSS